METKLVRIPIAVDGMSVRREVVLAEATSHVNCYQVRNIPAFAYGVAYGDTIKIVNIETGRFEVIARSGQVTLRAFVTGRLERLDVKALIEAVVDANGRHEVGKNDLHAQGASLLLLSLDVKVGFAKIESLMTIIEGPDVKWEYGNIYDSLKSAEFLPDFHGPGSALMSAKAPAHL